MVHVFYGPLVVLPLPADIDAVTHRFWNQCGHYTYTLFSRSLIHFWPLYLGLDCTLDPTVAPHTACPPAPPCQYPRTEGASN